MRSSWLLITGVGTVLAAESAPATMFTDVAASAGVQVYTNSPWGAGVAWRDLNNDGHVDLLMVDGVGDRQKVFFNDGDGTFTEITDSPLNDTNIGKAIVPADYDNDGDADILYTTYDVNKINRLYRNNGNGTFTDVSVGSGFDFTDQSTGAAWADYDNDGDLDCSILTYGYSHRDRLMKNLGNGVFVDVAIELGVHDPTGWGYQPGWFDYDNDGDQDLYYANDDFFGGTGNKLYRNNGNGTFTDVSVASGADIEMSAMGIAFGDYDHDLDFDIYMSNIQTGNRLLRNNADGTFTEVAAASGVGVYQICWGVDFIDMDHNGWLDLYAAAYGNGMLDPDGTPNFVFHNDEDGTFTDISAASGADNGGITFCSAWADYDRDGDLDLAVTNWWDATEDDLPSALYKNNHIDGGTAQDWLQVDLVGTVSNRDAIGSRVTVETASGTYIREMQAGTSYLSSSEPVIHFGLGGETLVTKLTVRWPSGIVQEFTNLSGGQRIFLVEGGALSVDSNDVSGFQISVGPNPSSGETLIRLGSPLQGSETLRIFDASGQAVRSLEPGAVVSWDGRGDLGSPLAAGTYFLRLERDGRVLGTRKVMRIR